MKLLLATTNANKLREIRLVLSEAPHEGGRYGTGVGYEFVTLGDLPPVTEPEETADTFWENARIKALAYAGATGLTTVAEDSGFEIDALDGIPGIHSARFLGPATSYPDRFTEIYRRLSRGDKPLGLSSISPARFITALAVARGSELLFETETRIDGTVAEKPAGQMGFGYDPIFWYPPFGRTTAEMTDREKTTVSHRARAFRDLHRWLQTRTDFSVF